MRSDSSSPWRELAQIQGLRRAWPEGDGTISYELVEPGSARLRAGRIDASGRPQLLPYAHDPALPSLRPPVDGCLVVHRPARRAVIVGESCVSKLVRRGRAPRLVPQAASDYFTRAGLRTAAVLGRTASRVDLELLPGRPLAQLGEAGLPAWARLGATWPTSPGNGIDLPHHTGSDEAAVLQRWLSRAQVSGALTAIDAVHGPGRLARAVDRVCAQLVDGPGPLVVAHRDLHDGQVLWDGHDLSLLDLDTAALAEAALDVANLTAHVDLMLVQGRLRPEAQDSVRGVLDGLAARLPTSARRLSVYITASRLRLAIVHAFRPRTSSWLPQWTAQCLGSGSPQA